jgi:hypothetical protein
MGPLLMNYDKSGSRCPRRWMVRGVVVGCNKRTCPVCGPRRAALTARTLLLDAQVDPPSHVVTLTTRATVSAYDFRKGMERLARALRKGGQRFEYFARVEFTSGASRGVRRMHAHVLCKGLTTDVRVLRSVVRKAWPHGWVQVAELRTVGGAIHYLGLHEAKASQLPPESWRGMAERASRGYWHRPVRELRKEAREHEPQRRGITADLSRPIGPSSR